MNSRPKRYRVEATPRFRRMLRKVDREAQHRTLMKLRELETKPYSFKRLHGPLAGRYTVRIGDHRVIYTIDQEEGRVVLHTVVHRRIAYKR